MTASRSCSTVFGERPPIRAAVFCCPDAEAADQASRETGMSKRGQGVHTVPSARRRWKNVAFGRTVSTHWLKRNAVRVGRAIAIVRKAEHVIHGWDGRIQEKNSYGNDPFPPRDER
jgi:hypothetical protein